MTRKKSNVFIMYISPFDEDEKITDYDGATLFGESTLSYKGEKLIYFMRKTFYTRRRKWKIGSRGPGNDFGRADRR